MATEKRLIDANALMQDFRLYMVANFDRERCAQKDACDICPRRCLWHNLITTAPTVDAGEVVHGQWKYYHKQNIAVCTNCSFERDLDANFGKGVSCPNCGAKMDGDGNA